MNHPTTPHPGERILAYLDTALSTAEQAAHAAAATDPAPWTAATGTEPTLEHDRAAGNGLLINAADEPLWECEESGSLCMTAAASIHAALHDPEAVLRRCAADRKLIAELAAVINGDYIDDGEPVLAERVLCGIAEGYGWTEAPDDHAQHHTHPGGTRRPFTGRHGPRPR
ncbi:DUF6221 family protein [Streptomyces microflavus]|uniref:DUF6221 family protein n=1 Tax=Streptomyces microflavus TaxID=1919 RepID=UPI003B227DB4